ncbi:MAG: 2-hydroxyacid dehydrogenase [Nitrososphaerota archaeon]|jgi:phosphoglycerate dehydrogenase-like enzyme|nr:2-hydroxyacid dehydrogenase [Nitrososphaerota archaeon]
MIGKTGGCSKLPKVVVLSPFPEGVIRSFFSRFLASTKIQVDFVTFVQPDMDSIKKELEDAEVVVGDYTFRVPITADMVEHMNKVKLIQQPSTGFNHIDIDACRRKGIPVANIGGANSISVAEHTIILALLLMKRIFYAHMKLIEGVWTQGELMNAATEISGKTWGIVGGAGRIGKEVAKRAGALGASLIYFDKVRLPEKEEKKLKLTMRPLENLLMESDIVSLHVPLTDETRGMIDEKRLRSMRPNAILINTSRGELVNENDLARSVIEGWIGGAGVDVFSEEPPGPSNPLVLAAKEGAPVILTPHIAGATFDARNRIIQTTVENVGRVLLGQPPENVVNP